MPSNKKLLQAAAGSAGGDSPYVEDVFSTYLYDGQATSLAIDNGIDLAGEGGLTWIKARTDAGSHSLFDTERTLSTRLISDSTNAEQLLSGNFTSFNSNGFTLAGNTGALNDPLHSFASWSFRKAEKFFDVVTWTGNGVAGREIAHNLGAVPGFIITKRTDGADNWKCYHVGNPSPAENYVIELDNTGAAGTESIWNNTAPTATNFTVSAGAAINGNTFTYVAYVFASDAGGFGEDETENIVSCGSYVGNVSSPPVINLGFEPQWILFKAVTGAYTWTIFDVMRGWGAAGNNDQKLHPNTSSAESADNWMNVTSTGFQPEGGDQSSNGNGVSYIYMAIRRPMKTPESGTEVFLPSFGNASTDIDVGFPLDLLILGTTDSTGSTNTTVTVDRLRGGKKYLQTTTTSSEFTAAGEFTLDEQNNFTQNQLGGTKINWFFKRATGFMDVVAYTTPGSTFQVVPHNLTVAPELIIVKRRNGVADWGVQYVPFGSNSALYLNSDAAVGVGGWSYFFTSVTAASMTGATGMSGYTAGTYIAYLFATLAGISKVGSYTGTAADLNVDCGFTAGARFILIKRTDSTGDWYVYDSARGISAGNDPYLLLNTTGAEVTNTDYIDPLASGFIATSNGSSTINVNGGTYIFLAIA